MKRGAHAASCFEGFILVFGTRRGVGRDTRWRVFSPFLSFVFFVSLCSNYPQRPLRHRKPEVIGGTSTMVPEENTIRMAYHPCYPWPVSILPRFILRYLCFLLLIHFQRVSLRQNPPAHFIRPRIQVWGPFRAPSYNNR